MFTKIAPRLIVLVNVAREDNVVQHSRMGSSEFGSSSFLLEKICINKKK
jgi:hypothetical protein